MMSAATVSHVMTADEFFALPDDGMERSLIRGQLREKPMRSVACITSPPKSAAARSHR